MSTRLVCGVGINDADYKVEIKKTVGRINGKQIQKRIWVCPFYVKWKNMLIRGYSRKVKDKYKTYEECAVCDEWLTFSNFRSWMVLQDWEGKQLDKDILVTGNKLYSPSTCCFVSKEVNSFLTGNDATRGEWPIGVNWSNAAQKFQSSCSDPFLNSRVHIGTYDTPEEAHYMWANYKYELACNIAENEVNDVIASALVNNHLKIKESAEGLFRERVREKSLTL
jgi:hypothetical protein